jgi:hypothetical protein
MCLQFGFVIFWQKDFGTKAAHKMMVKLTPGGIGNDILESNISTTTFWNVCNLINSQSSHQT